MVVICTLRYTRTCDLRRSHYRCRPFRYVSVARFPSEGALPRFPRPAVASRLLIRSFGCSALSAGPRASAPPTTLAGVVSRWHTPSLAVITEHLNKKLEISEDLAIFATCVITPAGAIPPLFCKLLSGKYRVFCSYFKEIL